MNLLWEYENGTMITDADTDHDGINDGAEFKYWQNYLYNEWNTWENVNETAVEYLKNPDVDRDNVTDGKEINGWKVKVITGYDENNNPISKEVTLYGDPLKPYMDKNGNYIDADEDNIPDIVESLLSNNSTFLKFTQFFHNSNSEYYNKSIWDNYNWTIAYFYSIALKGSSLSDADIKFYSILDNITSEPEYYIQFYEDKLRSKGNDKYTENATQWLRDEFNPLITESMPPAITQFAAVSDVGFFYAYTKVSVELRDPSGIGTVRLISKPEKDLPLIYDIRVFNANGAKIWKIKNLKLNITADAAAYHYFVVCNASDSLGNTAQWIKKVNGPVEVFVDTVAKLLSALWGFLCEVGETLAKAFEIIIHFLMDLLNKIIGRILEPLINDITGVGKDIAHSLWENTKTTKISRGENTDVYYAWQKFVLYLLGITGILLGLIIGIGLLIDAYLPLGGVVLAVISLVFSLYLYSLLEKYETYYNKGKDVGTSFDSIVNFLKQFYYQNKNLGMVLSEFFVIFTSWFYGGFLVKIGFNVLGGNVILSALDMFVFGVFTSIGMLSVEPSERNAAYVLFPIFLISMALKNTIVSIKEVITQWKRFTLGTIITLCVFWVILLSAGVYSLLTDLGFIAACFG